MPRCLQWYGLPPALAADPRCSYWGGAAGLWEPSEASLFGAEVGPRAQQLAEFAGAAVTARGCVRSVRGATPTEWPPLPEPAGVRFPAAAN
eukprot:8510457-Alexandrium_andersonii.AAC.1